MIDEPEPNTITRPYRGLSVQEVDAELTAFSLTNYLVGREVYRRTEFLLLENAGQFALVRVAKESTEPLFSPVTEARVLALPDQVVVIDSPETDVGNASALAAVARAHQRDGALAYAIKGRYEHINFIWRPDPLVVRVTEVVPPEPAKLFAMAAQVVAFDEDLPPIKLELDALDIRAAAGEHPSEHYLLPCRGSGVDLGGEVEFLDTRPAARQEWLLIGCERSMQFHRHFYGDEPARVDLCPRAKVEAQPNHVRTLSKCCLLERGVEVSDRAVYVPWGSNLDEVRTALRRLVGLDEPATPTVSTLAVEQDSTLAGRNAG